MDTFTVCVERCVVNLCTSHSQWNCAMLVMSMWILIGTRIFTAIVDINQIVCISNLKDDISSTGLLCIHSIYAVQLELV